MIVASALLLAFAPLSLPAGVRTFPEIAALVGETPTAVQCDSTIAHRAAFVHAKAISKVGLLRALGLEIVPDGQGQKLKDANRALDREWAGDVKTALARTYAQALTSRVRAAPPVAQADMQTAGVRALAEFPSDLPAELMERGSAVDTRPIASLSRDAVQALRNAYPELQGGRDSIVVRRRALSAMGSGLMLDASLKIVDPGIVVDLPWPEATVLWPERATLAQDTEIESKMPARRESMIERLRRKIEDRSLRLRRFESELSARRGDETEGRALVAAYTAEVPVPRAPLVSLSQVAELWAERGRDVILELDPVTEWTEAVFDGDRLRPEGDWSPSVVEGVLVLRPLLRFAAGERRYPYAALFALQAARVKPMDLRNGGRSYSLTRRQAEPYVRHAGPTDLWERAVYRQWWGQNLDRSASSYRVEELVPASLRDAAERRMAELKALPPGPNSMRVPMRDRVRTWSLALRDVPSKTLAAIAAEMRVPSAFSTMIVYSPAAWSRFVGKATLEISVSDSPVGPRRSVQVSAPASAFESPSGGPALYGLL